MNQELAVYACDIGNPNKGKFGWARAAKGQRQMVVTGGTSIDGCALAIREDLEAERPVSLGFECPSYVPIPRKEALLSTGRPGDKDRSMFAPAGCTVALMGLQQAVYLFEQLPLARCSPVFSTFQWDQTDPKQVFLWEAFVSGIAKTKNASHVSDAATAAVAFYQRSRSKSLRSDLPDVEAPCLSLLGTAVLWTGWTQDRPEIVIRARPIVIRPDKPYLREVKMHASSAARLIRRRARLYMTDGDFVTHEMGTLYFVDGRIVTRDSKNWFVGELEKGILGKDGLTLTFSDGLEFFDNIAFAWRDIKNRGVIIDDDVDLDAAKLAWASH